MDNLTLQIFAVTDLARQVRGRPIREPPGIGLEKKDFEGWIDGREQEQV